MDKKIDINRIVWQIGVAGYYLAPNLVWLCVLKASLVATELYGAKVAELEVWKIMAVVLAVWTNHALKPINKPR